MSRVNILIIIHIQTLEHINFNIDVYYQYISKFTFDTKFIDIPPKYAKSIITFYRYRYCNAKEDTLTMEMVKDLRELRELLDKEIKSMIEYWYKDDESYKEEDKGVF